MKYSYQREEILKVVKDSSGHISASEVYDEVKKTIPNISLGTVYRNLNSLVEHNYITKVNMPSGSDIFDYTLGEHSHIHCIKCDQIFDISSELNEEIKKIVETNMNCVVTKPIVFEGICHKCRDKKEG